MKGTCIIVLCLGLVTPSLSVSLRDRLTKLTAAVHKMRAVGDGSKPAFCNDLDCPEFTVLKTTDDYELREYSTSHWVSTDVAGIDFEEASYKLFMRLFGYISGSNKQKEKVAMTAPVLERIIPGQGPACENNFTMSFFVSSSVTSPPTPADPTVYLEKKPSMKVYVKSFGGFAEKTDWIKQAMALAQALPDTAHYNRQFYYTAGYDAPFKVTDRHNEVWFVAE